MTPTVPQPETKVSSGQPQFPGGFGTTLKCEYWCGRAHGEDFPTSSSSLVSHYGIAIVALIIFAGEMGLPILIPGELGLLVVGVQLIHSTPALLLAIVAFGVVDVMATSTLHISARTGGNILLRYLLRRFRRDSRNPEEVLAGWRARLGGRDALVIFVTRMIPVLRMFMSLASGLVRIRLRNFFVGAVPAAFIWAGIPLTTGYILRDRATGIEQHYNQILIVTLVLITLLASVGWVIRSRSRSA
ncbi:MAG: hypothetical protein NVSMB52_12790 [Chloroflexota bacterium]